MQLQQVDHTCFSGSQKQSRRNQENVIIYTSIVGPINIMELNLRRPNRALSLPRLTEYSEARLLQDSNKFNETKKIFMDRLNAKEQADTSDQNGKEVQLRPFIQFPKQSTQYGFTTFKSINKVETEQIFKQLRKMRSKTTLIQPFVKAQILLNKAEYLKISEANSLKSRQEKQLMAKRIKQMTPNIMKKQVKIQSKFKSKVKNVAKICLSLNVKLYDQNQSSYKPYIDYDVIPVSKKQQIFFIGGRKKTFPVYYNAITQKWSQIQTETTLRCYGDTEPTVVQGKILCFGGYDFFQSGYSQMSNTLRTIDIKTMNIVLEQFNENKVAMRAFHSQCLYGKYLIISGGLDKNSKLLNNFMNYHIQKKYWNQLTIHKMPAKLKNGFSKHRTVPIFYPRTVYGIYDCDSVVQKDGSIKQQGIYIYGGEDAENNVISQIFIMRLGQPSINIQELKTQGSPPVGRKNCTMAWYKEYLIIHGGRNQNMNPQVLNSIHFLNLRTLNWVKVVGQKPPYRHSHALSVFNDELLIMGGKGTEGLSKQVYLMPFQEILQYL